MANHNQLIYNRLDYQIPQIPAEGSVEGRECEKLRKRLEEMKHRLCLFEFGMGSVATLLQNEYCEVRKTSHKNDRKVSGAVGNHKQLIEGIVKILGQLETSLLAADEGTLETRHTGFRQDYQLPTATGVPCLVEVNPTFVPNRLSPKARIFIDETEFGGNSSTTICNIQVVDNSAIFSAGGSGNNIATLSHYSDPALAALSTLAAVATASATTPTQVQQRSVKNGMGKTSTRSGSKPKIGKESHLNYVPSQNVPFKKRKLMMDRNAKFAGFKPQREVV